MSYVFIGHGWNLDNVIDLTKYNATVVMLSYPTCLFDENRKHKQLLMQHGNDINRYIDNLLHPQSEVKNEFCSYSEKAPELLLTTYTKKSEISTSFLQQIGKISAEKIQKVVLLSEILEYLAMKEKGPFVLIVYACRCPLDHFQLENIDQFGEEATKAIQEIIGAKKIKILQDDEKGASIECLRKI